MQLGFSELPFKKLGKIFMQMTLACADRGRYLTRKAPNATIAEFANTVDPDETAHHEPSHLDLQCLPSSL